MSEQVNNAFYDDLKEMWYESEDHPIALLRAENRARIPWIIETIKKEKGLKCKILDIGCGGGLLANELALHGHQVTGVDLSGPSLAVAKDKDLTGSVKYLEANAYEMSFETSSFDVITAMDFLEHIDDPKRIVEEVGRLLKPKGLFFFHTFNRTWISWLLALKGVEWFVKGTPKNMHLYKWFIKPEELEGMLTGSGLIKKQIYGLAPVINRAFLNLLLTRRVRNEFKFKMTESTACGYLGYAIKG